MTPGRLREASTRRVKFAGALERVRRQGARARLRSLSVLLQELIRQTLFAVCTVAPLAPRILTTAVKRTRVQLRSCAYDVYGEGNDGLVIVYVHGGAWGDGRAFHYSVLAEALVMSANATVCVTEQRLWPDADMGVQAADVAAIVEHACARRSGRCCVLVGHSSGAHSAALALARGARVDAVVLQAGVYDPLAHYVFESGRGFESVSTMAPAANADGNVLELGRHSVARCLRSLRPERDADVHATPVMMAALEGDSEAEAIQAGVHPMSTQAQWCAPLGTFVMAATQDCVVPISSSTRFVQQLRCRGVPVRFLVYPHMSHSDFVTDWSSTSHIRTGVLDVDQRDMDRRVAAWRASFGDTAATLAEQPLPDVPPVAHCRDLLRILKAVERANTSKENAV